MTWLFVTGKNSELSTAEILCYFENREIPIEIIDQSETILVAGVDEKQGEMAPSSVLPGVAKDPTQFPTVPAAPASSPAPVPAPAK